MPQHDQHFKNLILDYPHDALAFFAAAEAALIDDTVRVTPILNVDPMGCIATHEVCGIGQYLRQKKPFGTNSCDAIQ